jgi:protein-arginine kinase activator protein McsA
MKKIKSSFSSIEEKLKKKGILGEPMELDPDWYEKSIAKRQAEIDAERKAEEDRIKKIKCPSCKSTSKDHIVKRDDNGIFGPGYSSWIIDEYFVCKKCGTMFKDMEKYNKKK